MRAVVQDRYGTAGDALRLEEIEPPRIGDEQMLVDAHAADVAETGGRWLGGTDRQARALMLWPFVDQKLGSFVASENRDDLSALTELIESGHVTAAVDRTYALSDVPLAIGHMEERRARGKVVITVPPGRPPS